MLENVVDFVRKDFVSDGCPAKVLFGKEHEPDNAAPLRVVFVPTRDSYGPPQQVRPSPGTPFGSGINPQPILLRKVGFRVDLWAAGPTLQDAQLQYAQDYALLNSLINQVCLSITRAVQGAWRQEGGSYVENSVNLSGHGQAYVLAGSVEMPVVDTDFRSAIDCSAYTWVLERAATFGVTVNVKSSDGAETIQSATLAVP